MLSASGFHTFLTLVEGYFAEKQIPAKLNADEGVIKPQANVFEQTSVFGLQNLAQACSQTEPAQWRDVIATHFNCIFTASDDQNALRIDVGDFGKIKDQLRARLYPIDLLNQSVETVHRFGPEGTLEVIVLDLPTSVRTVSRSEAREWPLDPAQLFEIGRQNLQRNGLLKDTLVAVQPGVEVHLYTGDTYYAGSHALIVDAYLPSHLHHGALVGMPKRDVLLLHVIRNIGTAEAIGSMLQAIIGMHTDGPGSLSAHLYWYRHGEFIALPYELNGQSLTFTPPSDFVEMLQSLADSADLS